MNLPESDHIPSSRSQNCYAFCIWWLVADIQCSMYLIATVRSIHDSECKWIWGHSLHIHFVWFFSLNIILWCFFHRKPVLWVVDDGERLLPTSTRYTTTSTSRAERLHLSDIVKLIFTISSSVSAESLEWRSISLVAPSFLRPTAERRKGQVNAMPLKAGSN